MDINGIGNINNKYNDNTMDNAKNKAVGDAFEEHLKSAMDSKDSKELKKACQEFEGILLGMLYKEMKATVPKTDLLEEDYGKEVFDSMLDDKLVDEASKNGSFGLAETLYKQLGKQLNTASKPEDVKDTKIVNGEK